MELFDTSLVALERAIAGAALRHDVLASNLANANTPGYRRQDVDFHSALERALAAGTTADVRAARFAAAPDASGPVRVDGSNVDVEREMASLVQNAEEYQALVATLRAQTRVLATVITGGRS